MFNQQTHQCQEIETSKIMVLPGYRRRSVPEEVKKGLVDDLMPDLFRDVHSTSLSTL